VSAGMSDGTTFNHLPEQLTDVAIGEVLQTHNAGHPVFLSKINIIVQTLIRKDIPKLIIHLLFIIIIELYG